MVLQQLNYGLSSQNHRVNGFEIPGDEQPFIFSTENALDRSDLDDLIQAAYRQIFNEQQLLASNRLRDQESQLKRGQITVKDFIRGLLLSNTFRERNFDTNNNYRFARMCIQRVLGREPYNDREVISRSIVIGTQGLSGFVDELLDSDEYLETFGEMTVPYQRRRILPQRDQGAVTFAHMPRYAEDHLQQLKAIGNDFERSQVPGGYRWSSQPAPTRWQWQKPPYPPLARRIAGGVAVTGAALTSLILLSIVLSWFGWIHI
ncbi:MAG: phycobilisome rod-core linker polypeptide [Leptolyngbyaceae cyanobacterium]